MKADIDLHEFKKIRNDRNEIIRIGLWKYSRHPNYFGEICFWYGVAMVYVFCDFTKNWYYIFGAVLDNALFLGISIPLAEKNLRPHLKYFYAMKLFRNHAIITIDDDMGYSNDTFNSLFNAYLENPNLISGRRSHIIKYKKNGELKQYANWKFQQHSIKLLIKRNILIS